MDQAFYESVLDSLNEGVYFVNRKRQVLYWNKAAERLSGFSSEEMLGKRCADNALNHVDECGKHLCRKGCPLAASMRDGEPREVDVFMHHKCGHRLPVHIRSLPIRDENGKITGSAEIFSDNSKRFALASEVETLRKEVMTDALTGLGNRRHADITLSGLENALRLHQHPFGVIFVDIDNFKTINDTWGHKIGDRVISTVAKTLSATLRPSDVACRWGGDEFVILIPHATEAGLTSLGNRLLHLVKESWIDLAGERLCFSASFGGALSQSGDSANVVLDRADSQLYLCKENGRGCYYLTGVRH